jgi:signal transduction histidine kinase
MTLDAARLQKLLESLEGMAGGDLSQAAPISGAHDELDAIGHGVNVLVGELRYAGENLNRAKEEAERANRAKTEFLRNVSHDIRTPITAILALSELLAQPDAEGERRIDLAKRVHSNANALIALVDDLLDLSKVEAGKLPFEIQPVRPADAVAEVIRNFEMQAAGQGVRLVLEPARDTPARIATDGRRLRQILTNVIGNALKFTERGQIVVRLMRIDEALVAIDVQDTGIGIANASALFQPFVQADAHSYGGTGLGLVLSRRLARGLGGDLTLLASQPGEGSSFRITLAIHPELLAGDEAKAPPRKPVAPRPLAGFRILLAEDHEDIRLAINDLLVFGGAEVAQVGDGRSAADRALGEAFDAVLMDVRMPGLDGLSATRLLRQRGSKVPVIALTADAVKEHRAECLAAGYDDYLPKPVEYDQLVDTLLKVAR